MKDSPDLETEIQTEPLLDGGRLGELVDSIENIDVDELVDRAGRWVRDHPLLALAGAAGVGFLVALAVRSGGQPGPSGRSRGMLREAAGDVGRELETRAEGLRAAASREMAAVAASIVDPVKAKVSAATEGETPVSDTLKAIFASLALKKVGEWLSRRV
jgi:hypothetical protein